MNTKKKLENIWYYYKIPIIITIIVIYVISITVINKLSVEKFDNSIAIISKENYPDEENVAKLTEIFEEKYNQTFEVVIYNVELGETGQDEAIISKLDLDLCNKLSTYFFIEDLDAFKKATANIEFSDVTLVKDTDYLNNLGLDNFYFCIRK